MKPYAISPSMVLVAFIAATMFAFSACNSSDSTDRDKRAQARKEQKEDRGTDKHKQNDDHAKNAEARVVSGKGTHEKDEKHEKDEHGKHASDVVKLSDDERKTVGLRIGTVAEEEISEPLVVTATIQANQDRVVKVSPRVPGRVIKVNVNRGDSVQAGQALAVIDSIEIGEARSAYLQAESEASVARASHERAERLHAEQITSQKDYLRAKADHQKAQAALRAAADKLQILGLPPNTGGTTGGAVSAYALTAPFAGTVFDKKAVLGELAQPDAALFTVADLSTVWIEANIYERDLARVKPGDAASITVAAFPTEHFKGRLTYFGGAIDKDTRTLQARIEVKNGDGRLRPGMFATASIDTARKVRTMVLPDEAVTLLGGQPTVFVEEHGGFEPRAVELGERLRGRVIVKSGLEPGEDVAVSGTYALKARVQKSQIGEGHAH